MLLGELRYALQLQHHHAALSTLFDGNTDIEVLVHGLHFGGPDERLVVAVERIEGLDVREIIVEHRVHQASTA